MYKCFEMELGGRKVTVETGRLAEQANGACLVRCGDTAVLVTATASKSPRDGIDFFPLTVDFEAKLYSVGKIPGGFIKREGRPPEKSILTSRLMDRPIRPLFPKGFRNDVQVVATALSVDTDIPPDVYAMIGSSVALSISDIPFQGPTGSVVIGYVDGKYITNPGAEERERSLLNLTVSGTRDAVMMVEAGAQMISEQEMLDAILYAHEEIKKIVSFIDGIVAEVGAPKGDYPINHVDEAIDEAVRAYATDKIRWAMDTFDRKERQAREDQVKAETQAYFAERFPEGKKDIDDSLYAITKETVRRRIVDEGIRPDGRKLTEVRPIWGEVGLLPRAHGSGIFTRGQTQVLSIATLGPVAEQQKLDDITDEEFKRYMHQYNMPPFSTGEAKPLRSPGRREVGHGALAERALLPVIPDEERFPYCIRVVSEVLSSNGSTSQASVCGSTMALMDAGVPIKAPVAGVAMGLIQDEKTGTISILTDIQGLEDFLGDMDFKVAGTAEGITAIQMDIKIKGINREILERALEQARLGRLHILSKMLEVIPEPRKSLSPFAPKIVAFSIDPEKIGEVVGPRGKTINKIIADTGVKIDIEDDGRVFIATNDEAAAAQARGMIEAIVKVIEVGEIYYGKVVRLMNFGAFVELLPGKDGMVHISKLADHRVEKVEDEVKVGDEILVKVVEIDDKGRVNLSRKGLIEEEKRIKEERSRQQ